MFRTSRVTAVCIAGAIAFTACGGDAEADSCEEVVDETLALIQNAIDQASEMSMADLAAEEEPAFVAELETEGAALEERAEELDCDEQQVIDRLDEIDVEEGSVGELILEQIRSEGLG
jgi:hypothetical protein